MEVRFPEFTPRQHEALVVARTHRYTLYGGAAGGGKSFWLRWWLVHFLIACFRKYSLKSVNVGMFCESYPALEQRQLAKVRAEFPSWLGTMHGGLRQFRLLGCWGNGVISFLNLDDPDKYRSAEFGAIAIDELTLNPRSVFEALLWRIRWPGLPEGKFVAGTNPTGIGHSWTRKLWIDRDFRGEPDALKPEYFAYVPAKVRDNPHLPTNYETETLASLPEQTRKALMDGSWDVVAGQFFPQWKGAIHVRPPRPYEEGLTDEWGMPKNLERIGGIDWGRAAPWAAVVGAVDTEGRVLVYAGVAVAGWEHDAQAEWMLAFPGVTFYAGDDCFTKGAANQKELRMQDFSHYELWQQAAERLGGSLNIIRIASGPRIAGWQQVGRFLQTMPGDPSRAWIEFTDVPGLRGDHGIITTLPKLIHDPNKTEDVHAKCDDHSGEALRRLLVSRPAPTTPAPVRPVRERYSGERKPLLVRGGGASVGGW